MLIISCALFHVIPQQPTLENWTFRNITLNCTGIELSQELNLGLLSFKRPHSIIVRNLEFVLRWQKFDIIKARIKEDYSRSKGRFLT